MLNKFVLPLIVVVALVGAGCSKKNTNSPYPTATSTNPNSKVTSGPAASPLSGTVSVTIKNFAYSPAILVVKKGTVLTVTNQDSTGHSFTADDGSFNTGVLAKGASQSITLDKVGTFKVHCIPHPSITGTVTVVE